MSDIAARKLAPIYDCIDDQNFKGEIKLCQKKDIANWDITKTLLGYCLVCSHKVDEGLAIAREIKV